MLQLLTPADLEGLSARIENLNCELVALRAHQQQQDVWIANGGGRQTATEADILALKGLVARLQEQLAALQPPA